MRAAYTFAQGSYHVRPLVDFDLIYSHAEGYRETGAGALEFLVEDSSGGSRMSRWLRRGSGPACLYRSDSGPYPGPASIMPLFRLSTARAQWKLLNIVIPWIEHDRT
jgi:hypothetical protein